MTENEAQPRSVPGPVIQQTGGAGSAPREQYFAAENRAFHQHLVDEGEETEPQRDFELLELVTELQTRIAAMEGELSRAQRQDADENEHPESATPRFRVFPARTPTSSTFVEQVVVSGTLADLPALQARTGDLITPSDHDQVTVLEVEDGAAKKFVQIASGSGGVIRGVVLSHSPIGTFRWVYSVQLLDGSALTVAATNGFEDGNPSAVTTYPIGIPVAGISEDSDCQILPIGPEAIVHLIKVDSIYPYEFSAPNSVGPTS